MSANLAQLRLRVKRAFSRYYLELCSPAIADPTHVTEALAAYFQDRRRELGSTLFQLEFDDDIGRLAGEIEQDLRQRHRELAACLQRESLEGRLRECVELVGERRG